MSILESLFMPVAVIVAAYLLGRSAEKVARTLRTERRPERVAQEQPAPSGGRARRLPKMTAIARRQGWSEADLDRRMEELLSALDRARQT